MEALRRKSLSAQAKRKLFVKGKTVDYGDLPGASRKKVIFWRFETFYRAPDKRRY